MQVWVPGAVGDVLRRADWREFESRGFLKFWADLNENNEGPRGAVPPHPRPGRPRLRGGSWGSETGADRQALLAEKPACQGEACAHAVPVLRTPFPSLPRPARCSYVWAPGSQCPVLFKAQNFIIFLKNKP